MKYTIDKSNYRDFDVFAKNRLPRRSYFIPYPDRTSAEAVSPAQKRYQSPKVRCLNGDWDFRFYPRPAEVPAVLDTDEVSWDRIPVPGCWQFYGYDKPFYVNIRYQFPFNPPKIPEEEKVGKVFTIMGNDNKIGPVWQDPGEEYNFVGIYRTTFDVSDLTKRYEISFLGVASCIDCYVNGQFAGYAEGAHNTAEFDLTSLVKEGTNEMVCVVHRWCNGSYLESQDMFRNNGIFRDVLLRVSDPADIFDIGFRTKKENGKYTATVSAKLYQDALAKNAPGGGPVNVTIEDGGVIWTAQAEVKDGRAKAVLEGLDVEEWSAENPKLYDLFVETGGTCIHTRVGFKTIEINGRLYTINGSRVKFKGVNHHDSTPTGGYTMTPEEIERDMKLCKEFNIDTVRTSHYPPDPYLLEICDELGIYVVDEADIETHGTFTAQFPPSYNQISHNPAWKEHYLDRAKALFQRDKLHPCVVLWSLGNEAGGYCNQDAMYAYLKARTDIPIHYESAIHSKRRAYDVGSEMYPSAAQVHKVGEGTARVKELNDRPYFMCEYVHAMGVGPGGAEEYWKEIYNYDSLMGGCIWEMTDHAVLHPDGTYTYGGDHGEWEHDGNFCVDGIFYPDRKPSTGAWVMRHVYRPIRVSWLGTDRFEIFNTTAFSEGSRYQIEARFSDGTKQTIVPEAGPLSRDVIALETEGCVKAAAAAQTDALVDFVTTDTVTGREVSVEQIVLAPWVTGMPEKDENRTPDGVLTLIDGRPSISVAALAESCAEGFEDGFEPAKEDEKTPVLTASDPYTILFRAPTDNERNPYPNAPDPRPFIQQTSSTASVEYLEGGKIRIVSKIAVGRKAFAVTDEYQCVREGVLVTSRICPDASGKKWSIPGLPAGILPRFGKAFALDESFDGVTYLARCGESYVDMEQQFPIRKTECTVADMTEPNIRPQESGNRRECRYVTLDNGAYEVTFTAVGKPFELGIKPYTDKALLSMKHREDEVRTGTYVTLSGIMMGIGTGSCGPATLPQYCYPADREYSMQFLISAKKK